MRPIDITQANKSIVLYGYDSRRDLLLNMFNNRKKVKHKVDENVRLRETPKPFDRGFNSQFSHHIYKIDKTNGLGKTTNRLKDFSGRKSKRRFYDEDIQP